MIRHPSAYQAMDHLDGSASNLNPLPNQYSPSLLNDPFRLSLEDHSPLVLRPGPDEGGQRGQDGDDRSSPLPRGNQQEQSVSDPLSVRPLRIRVTHQVLLRAFLIILQ